MDFFDAQEQSRRRTRLLIGLYLLATLAVAAAVTAIFAAVWLWSYASPLGVDAQWLAMRWPTLATVAGATIAFIGLAALFRVLSLRGGGAQVARQLGGTPVPPDTTDPLRRRLRNVVEEMAIASGVPVPEIFVLEQEEGINAFAAGYRTEDAIVAVTRGALEQLDRDELQGVIGHEFSHILNGDMRLNLHMLGPLFGIMVIGWIGHTLLRNLRLQRSIMRVRESRGSVPVFLVAFGLVIVGWVGVVAARLIRAAVSRQREYLADASAVQFTRQPGGLAGALKKIGGLSGQSYLQRADGEEISHMLFAEGASVMRLFATHPPLVDRIKRLDPAFSGSLEAAAAAAAEPIGPGAAGLAAARVPGDTRFALDAAQVPPQAGNPDASQVAAAHGLHRNLPPALYAAAHSDDGSLQLALALMLHDDDTLREPQLLYLGQQLGPVRAAEIAELHAALRKLGPQYRLPLLDMAFPTIKQRPPGQLEFLVGLMRHLARMDARVELFEYCLARILETSLVRAGMPGHREPRARARLDGARLRAALLDLFAVLARHGHADAKRARAAFAAGVQHLSAGLKPDAEDALRGERDWQTTLDEALAVLASLRFDDRRRLVAALTVTATFDGQITVAESELLRVFCAVLDCPLPPLYATAEKATAPG